MKRITLAVAVILLSAAFAASAAAVPLRILTYNVGLLRVLGSDLVPIVRARGEAAPREIARFAAERAVDVIVLQEIWKSSTARAITEALAPLGFEVVRPRACTVIGKEGGLLLAVRQPLRVASWSFTKFETSTFVDSLASKGVLRAVIENASAGGAPFALLATHTVALDTDRGAPVDAKQVAALRTQALQILSLLEKASEAGSLPALIVGDFNVGPGYADASYRTIADAPRIREAGAVAAPGEALVTWDPANPLVRCGGYPDEPAAKIDHVFVRDGSIGRWQAVGAAVVFTQTVTGLSLVPSRGAEPVPTPLSDHYGFLADLVLEVSR